MTLADKVYKLNTGATIPALGLGTFLTNLRDISGKRETPPKLTLDKQFTGTWKSSPEETQKAVYHAIKAGYRHIDTAFAYQNEVDVGKGIKKALDDGLVKREDLFITTKLWAIYADRVAEGLELSLQALGVDYLDLYLVHWPIRMNANGTTWATNVSQGGMMTDVRACKI
jgi:glycerol 2-dehydrogenase (NADP+)